MLLQADTHTQLDTIDHVVRILGWPTFLSIVIWVVRKYDAGRAEFKSLCTTTAQAVAGVEEVKQQVTVMQTNHLAHLQQGIDKVAASNDEAVKVLQDINKGITIVLDRVPR